MPYKNEKNQKWLNGSCLQAINETFQTVLEVENSYMHDFPSYLEQQLNNNCKTNKVCFWVDGIFGEEFTSIFSHFVRFIHDGLYDSKGQLLYALCEFMDNLEDNRVSFHDEMLGRSPDIAETYANKNFQKEIESIVSEVVEEYSRETKKSTHKKQLEQIMLTYIHTIMVALSKLCFAVLQKDYSVCLQELCCLASDLIDNSC